MKCTDNNADTAKNNPDEIPQDKRVSVIKSTIHGAAIGSVLWPGLGIAFDAISKHKMFVPGNRLKFIVANASLGALVNGALNGILALWQNHIHHHDNNNKGQQK